MKTDNRLRSCPFCGKVPLILICDKEGNICEDDYEKDPWCGLSYAISHEADISKGNDAVCPIATFEGESIGTLIYDSVDELVEDWNRRRK